MTEHGVEAKLEEQPCYGCLEWLPGASPLCPHAKERQTKWPCILDIVGDASLIAWLDRLSRVVGLNKLLAGEMIDRRHYGLEWYGLPGYEWETVEVELDLVIWKLHELTLREDDDPGLAG